MSQRGSQHSGDIMVFGTYEPYVIMSIMMMVMIVMFFPSAQFLPGASMRC